MNRSVSEEDAGRFCGWMVVVRTRVLAFPGEGRCQITIGNLTDESFPCYVLD